MEIILALVVGLAVIFFGALISMGNERQRRAIDDLREQLVLWAMQDLRIKRERLAREVHVDDPLGWLNKMVARVCGRDLNLQVLEAHESPRVLVCASGNEKIIFTSLAPREIHALKYSRQNRLSRYVDQNPLLALSRNVVVFECSVLNGGMLFDLELPLAWKGLTGQAAEPMERVWMYVPRYWD